MKSLKILRREYTLKELFIFKKSILRILVDPRKIANFLLIKLSFFLKSNICLGLPINLNIEPSGECNYNCLKCGRLSDAYFDPHNNNKNKQMPFVRFRRIIDDIGKYLLTLRLWHFGEPLMNQDIVKMVKYAKEKNIIVAISSNLSLLDAELAEGLIREKLDYLLVSFDGASAETYKLYHGVDGFNSVINNIKTIVGLKKKLKTKLPFIELQFIVMKENENEINSLNKLAHSLGVNKLSYVRLDATFIGDNVCKSREDILPRNKNYVLNENKAKSYKNCEIPWTGSIVRYSGDVIPCVTDVGQRFTMGNLFPEGNYFSFRRIWNNNKYIKFRKSVSKGIDKSSICFGCLYRNNNNEDQIKMQ